MVWLYLFGCHTHKWSSFLVWSYYQYCSCGLAIYCRLYPHRLFPLRSFSIAVFLRIHRSKSWLLTCSSNITLSLPSYTNSVLKRGLNFCNGYLSLLYFWAWTLDKLVEELLCQQRPIVLKTMGTKTVLYF